MTTDPTGHATPEAAPLHNADCGSCCCCCSVDTSEPTAGVAKLAEPTSGFARLVEITGEAAPAPLLAAEAWAEIDRLRRVNREWELVLSTLIDGLAERGVPTPLGGTYTQAALDEIDRLRED